MHCKIVAAISCLMFAGMQRVGKTEIGYEDPSVQVTVTKTTYCADEPMGEPRFGSAKDHPHAAITLRLRVRLCYRNVGTVSLILPIYHEISGLIVSRVGADRKNGQNRRVIRFKPRRDPMDELPENLDTDVPVEPYFAFIPPNQVFNTYDEDVVLPVHNPRSANKQFELLGQKIHVQLKVSHSGLSPALSRTLGARWQKSGRLWIGRVLSQMIEIDIPVSPQIGDCSHDNEL